MNVCVIGATGLIGRHVVEALSAAGECRVIATHRVRTPFEVPHVDWLPCDLNKKDEVARVLQDADVVVCCAGQLSTSAVLKQDPSRSVLGTLRIATNVLEAAARIRLRRLVLVSSCTGYPKLSRPAVEADFMQGDPSSQWFGVGWMHRYVEQQLRWYVEHLKLIESAVVLRPTLVFGPHDDFDVSTGHFVPAMIVQVVRRAQPIEIWGDGNQTRNLLHASDFARAVRRVLKPEGSCFEAYNVATEIDVSVNEVVRELVDIDGFSDAKIVHLPARSGGPGALQVSGAAFASATGWKPRLGLREGLTNALEWYRRGLI